MGSKCEDCVAMIVDLEITLPMGFITTYNSTKEDFISVKYENEKRLQAKDEARIYRRFDWALEKIVEASCAIDSDEQEHMLFLAYRFLVSVTTICDKTSSTAMSEKGLTNLPGDVIKLYGLAKDAQQGSLMTREHNRRCPVLFMAALDHIIDAARPGTSYKSKIEYLALTKECLQRIAYDTYNEAVSESLRKIEKARRSNSYKARLFFRRKLSRFLDDTDIESCALDITRAYAEAYRSTSNVQNPTECVHKIQKVYIEAEALRKQLRQFRWAVVWAPVGIVLLGVITNLITPWFEALKKLITSFS
jgi:hypothetical protein